MIPGVDLFFTSICAALIGTVIGSIPAGDVVGTDRSLCALLSFAGISGDATSTTKVEPNSDIALGQLTLLHVGDKPAHRWLTDHNFFAPDVPEPTPIRLTEFLFATGWFEAYIARVSHGVGIFHGDFRTEVFACMCNCRWWLARYAFALDKLGPSTVSAADIGTTQRSRELKAAFTCVGNGAGKATAIAWRGHFRIGHLRWGLAHDPHAYYSVRPGSFSGTLLTIVASKCVTCRTGVVPGVYSVTERLGVRAKEFGVHWVGERGRK